MITITFSGNKAIEINGKRYKPNASYEFTEKEWGEMYEKSFFVIMGAIVEVLKDKILDNEPTEKKKPTKQ